MLENTITDIFIKCLQEKMLKAKVVTVPDYFWEGFFNEINRFPFTPKSCANQ